MFDIGFWEILLIGIVTLLVVGPQRLPGVAVFVGHWVGRIRRFVRNMRDEINEELETEHLKSLLAEQNREISELRRDVDAVRGDTERTFREAE
jgi:sec-independent protein translocase protein TatB